MSTPQDPIRLDQGDLYSPRVEAYLEEQEVLRRPVPETPPAPLLVRIFYSGYFYLSLASGLGAFLAWAVLEPFFDETAIARRELSVANLLIFPAVAGMIGLFLGGAEGLMCRNFLRAAICALVGLGIGFGGGLVAVIAANCIFGIMAGIAIGVWKNPRDGEIPTGLALLILMMGRAAAWAVAALPAGLGQGIALRERKVILNGLLGGVLGGLLGGLLFDPISIVTKTTASAGVSRAVGFTVIGLMVGLFVGLVEQWTKTAWLLMRAGPLAGKQFVLHRNPTVLGSSPKADVYLFKDAAIEPRHALIHNRGGRFEIEDCQSADGTYVNGEPVSKRLLQAGDQIVLGKTVLEFALKDS
jgi:hypothetical protein